MFKSCQPWLGWDAFTWVFTGRIFSLHYQWTFKFCLQLELRVLEPGLIIASISTGIVIIIMIINIRLGVIIIIIIIIIIRVITGITGISIITSIIIEVSASSTTGTGRT
jgi:hypothetical protein